MKMESGPTMSLPTTLLHNKRDTMFYKGAGIGRYYESLTKEFVKKE